MNCKKCGAILQSGVRFCKKCGAKVDDTCEYGDNIKNSVYDERSCHQKQYNYSYQYSNKQKPKYNLNASHEDQYNYSTQFTSKYNFPSPTTVGDERYIEAYVGKNYTIIKNSKFSFATLIFGGYHLLYRRLYGYAFLYFIATIASNILLGELSQVANIAINVFAAIKFNKIYMEHVNEKVDQIKQSNFDKTSLELIEECRKKGGPSAASAILIPIVCLILGVGLILYFGLSDYFQDTTTPLPDQQPSIVNSTIGQMSYSIPSLATQNTNTWQEKTYIYTKGDVRCNISIKRILSNVNTSEYIDTIISPTEITELKTKYINSQPWLSKERKTYTTYLEVHSTSYNNNLYSIETSSSNVYSLPCSTLHNEIVNSTKF